MTLSLTNLKPYFLNSHLDERKLASLLENIKVMYTIDRKGLPSKKWSEDEVSAYSAFYLTTNAAKFEWVMNQLSDGVREELARCDVIDFGTGPGTYLVAFCEYFGNKAKGQLFGVDKEELMIKQARKICDGLYPELGISILDYLPKLTNNRKKLLIFGNSCNELSVKEIQEVIRKADADLILFIEPGTPVVYDQMMALRADFKKNDFECLYPCPSLKYECPVKKRVDEGREDWCHQVWRGTHDMTVERIGQMAKIDRKAMPMIAHLYAKDAKEKKLKESNEVRFIRYLNESKHAFTWEVCLLEEDNQKVCVFEIAKRSLSKSDQKYFKKMSVGENFKYELIKKISDEHYRVAIELSTIGEGVQ